MSGLAQLMLAQLESTHHPCCGAAAKPAGDTTGHEGGGVATLAMRSAVAKCKAIAGQRSWFLLMSHLVQSLFLLLFD
jgi:hypothetical protein